MKQQTLLILAVFALIATHAEAGALSFLVTPYTWLDQYTMLLWGPLIKLVLISWAKPVFCTNYGTIVTDTLSMSNGMTDAEADTYC